MFVRERGREARFRWVVDGWMEWEGGYGGEMEVLRGWDEMGWVVNVCAVGEEKRKKERGSG